MNYQCLICQIKSLEKRIDKYGIPNEKRNQVVAKALGKLASLDLQTSFSPEITRHILAELQKNSTIADPYLEEKEKSNQEMLNRYDEFKNRIHHSLDPFDTALRLAIAGNIIDFGPTHSFDVEKTINEVLYGKYSIDHSKALHEAISQAKTILYLGDNCGETVLDKLFIETIAHPDVWYGVREKPVLNDVTLKEAYQAGIHRVARIISNGDDAPSTLLHRVSPEFTEIYQKADLIISKGMGNYEGLMHEADPRLFFLLMIKCDPIGRKIGADRGEFVVKRAISEHLPFKKPLLTKDT